MVPTAAIAGAPGAGNDRPGWRFVRALCHRAATHSTSRLTTIEGSSLPSMPASTLRAVETAMRIAASLLRPALCGVRITLGSASSGWSSRRLALEHIQAGAGDPARGERVVQGRLVDDAAARGVDHEGMSGQGSELGRADQAVAVGAERHVHGQHSKRLRLSQPATLAGSDTDDRRPRPKLSCQG